MEGIARRLRQAREEAGLTLKDVAQMTGAGVASVGRYERMEVKPTAEYIATFSRMLGADAAWILMGTESPAHAKIEMIQAVLDGRVPTPSAGASQTEAVSLVSSAFGDGQEDQGDEDQRHEPKGRRKRRKGS